MSQKKYDLTAGGPVSGCNPHYNQGAPEPALSLSKGPSHLGTDLRHGPPNQGASPVQALG
jgi:hypothetical protein